MKSVSLPECYRHTYAVRTLLMQVKIAFLCLAHNNFEYLDKLADYYSSDGDQLFVHIDARVTSESPLNSNNKVVLLPRNKRLASRWGTYQIVEASLALLNQALAADSFDYFILISGADVPLLSKAELKAKLIHGHSYFSQWQCISSPVATKAADISEFSCSNHEQYKALFSEFFHRHHYQSWLTNPGEAYLTQQRWRIYAMLLANKFIARFPLKAKSYFTYPLYVKGSQWWGMTKALASYVSEQLADPKINRQFKLMHAPDEKAIQTVAANSPFVEQIAFDYEQSSLKQGLHFIDWGYQDESKTLQLFSMGDIDKAIAAQCSFARKISPAQQSDFIAFTQGLK